MFSDIKKTIVIKLLETSGVPYNIYYDIVSKEKSNKTLDKVTKYIYTQTKGKNGKRSIT